ncbi:NAD(P)/FAD-dependent oxidoreductase [Actinoplanes sp. M2I2]|uniref:FAD-dependent oxidoreductase n=1 Tax=Actinoplanes sp. M2I2 TaxID=1734444 RepID=UPI00202011CF|nr:NAD(P)/FAD-dependent oxidoreductase [Actinoplanes sp. M2I2]
MSTDDFPQPQPRGIGTVAIIGAGPGGLALARLLQVRGVSATVYERDGSPTARRQGGSLDLRPDSGQRAIRAAGLEEVFARSSREEAKAFQLISSQGEVIPAGAEETHEDAGPEIDRGDLRQLLLDSLRPDAVAWGHTVQDVEPAGDGRWRVRFDEHPPVTADLVVGADGIGSRVRRRLTDLQPFYTGHTMLAATMPEKLWRDSEISDVVGDGSVMFAGGGRTVFAQRCAGDLILLYFSMKVPRDWPGTSGFEPADTDSMLMAVADAYQDWSPELLAMLLQVEGPIQLWPLSVMPPEHRWHPQPGLTMLGDAAHVMPPFTGKGVNLALLDALELADALTGPDPDPAASVADFEQRMQARTVVEISACLGVGRDFYGIDMDFSDQAEQQRASGR